jgi:hypothetical protein
VSGRVSEIPVIEMTVRLIKRKDLLANSEKQTQPPSPNRLTAITQGWIEEFREQQAKNQQSINDLIRRN